MSDGRKPSHDDSLEAYLATLRSPGSKEAFKRRAGLWPLYAAVTSSAVAFGAPAPVPHELPASHTTPLIRAGRLAKTRRMSRPLLESAAVVTLPNSQMSTPSIAAGGVVPLYGSVSYIQPGEWVSIFGTNLSSGTAVWNGDFPTTLGGTSVEINGRPAYLSFVSPTQINLQAPDDTASGAVQVVVTTSAGRATASVTLTPYSPSFDLLDQTHVTAIILRSDGSGAFGNGAYDILGPTGDCWGYRTVGHNPAT